MEAKRDNEVSIKEIMLKAIKNVFNLNGEKDYTIYLIIIILLLIIKK